METVLRLLKTIIPKPLFNALQPTYHKLLAWLGCIVYRNPSKHMHVIAVTGTKGKSSTTELINAILEEAGYMTAVMGTIRFKIGDDEIPNLYKMSMPGRFFIQSFLSRAHKAGCQYVVIEATSEGAKLFRHTHIDFDTFIFTNIAPEHIESHGSFENYLAAKLSIKDAVDASPKENKHNIVNRDDAHAEDFLESNTMTKLTFGLKDAEPYATNDRGVLITIDGMSIHSPLIGKFNIYNILAATTFAKTQNIPPEKIKKALETIAPIKGRAEKITAGQDFTVVVDYAHTPDSLKALYEAFPQNKICVLGNCGGGRDTWKRPEMGAIADEFCSTVILTNEDPYDEDPRAIVEEMATAMHRQKPMIIMDRREAIAMAFKHAGPRDAVLISGKGTDPYIMEAKGKKTSWSDATVAKEEIQKLLEG